MLACALHRRWALLKHSSSTYPTELSQKVLEEGVVRKKEIQCVGYVGEIPLMMYREGREKALVWPEREETLQWSEVKTRRRPREYVLMSKELLAGAGKVWEAGPYCLMSVRLTKRSLHMVLHDDFFLIPRSWSVKTQMLHCSALPFIGQLGTLCYKRQQLGEPSQRRGWESETCVRPRCLSVESL